MSTWEKQFPFLEVSTYIHKVAVIDIETKNEIFPCLKWLWTTLIGS